VDKFKNFALNLIFPKFCFGCKKEGLYLCDDCRTLLDISEFDYCLCNPKPVRISNENTHNQTIGKCPKCQNKNLSGLYFALPYKEKTLTRKLIYQFKYPPYLKDLAQTLASILIEHFVLTNKNTNKIWDNSVLVPVPLDKKKIKIRGYNQSEELAKELSKVLQVPVVADCLIKTKFTNPQMESKKEEREKNLENVFQTKNYGKIAGKKVFLIDDVYTTGSTLQECAKVLREAGIKNVWGICLAREE